MIGRLLLEWRTQQALEYEKRTKQYTKEETFQDNQMVYLLASHLSALQTDTTKFKQDFIGPLFIDTALNKTHYRLKDATGLLLDGMYHMNQIKKGYVCILGGTSCYGHVCHNALWADHCHQLLSDLVAYCSIGLFMPLWLLVYVK